MEESALDLDIYHNLIRFMDWNTLNEFSKTNYFCYEISKKEKEKRLKCKYPLGEINGRVKMIIEDDKLISFTLVFEKTEFPISKYSLPCVRKILIQWFSYKFITQEWILTFKLTKEVIRLLNRNPALLENFNHDRQIYIFKFLENGNSVLECIM